MCKKVQLAKKKANQLNIKHYQGGTVYEKKINKEINANHMKITGRVL